MNIIVFDRDENRIADLNPEAIKTPSEIEDDEGVMTFSFQYAITEEDVSSLEGGNFVAFVDELENIWKEYEIVETTEGTQFLSVSCEHRYYGLAAEEMVTWNTNADNASIAMGYTLQKTRWQVGIVENTRALKRDVFEKNPLESLRFIEREWGGVLRFRIEITGSGDHAFYVDLLERRGSITGLRFELGHNLKDFEHTVSFGLLKTALYGRGQGQAVQNQTDTAALTFTDVEWSIANGDPADKPFGQDWIGFEDKRLLYGTPDGNGGRNHLFGRYDSQATTPEGLLWETYYKLVDASDPLLNVRASVIDLEKYSPDFSHETVRLGDTSFLVAVYENRNIALTADIKRIERNPDDFSATVVELGNYLPVYSKRMNEIEKNVSLQQARAGIYERAGALNPDGTVPTSILSGVIDAVQNEFHSSVGFTYQTAEGILVLNDDRDTGNPTKAMLISGGSFFLANAKNPDGSWKWRTFGNGDGFIADEIISGSIKTDLVEVFGSANFKWNGDNIYITNPTDARQQIRIGKYDGTNYGIAFTTDGGANWQNSLDFNGLHISYTKVEGLSTQLSSIDTKATDAQTAASTAQTAADNAQADADTAQQTANSATAAASTAQTAADNAKAAADAAQADADTAAQAASTAQTTANNAQSAANTANNLLTDIANDNKLTANEKQSVKKEWDIIGGEKANIDAQATTYGITTEKTDYDNSYSALNTYITPLLSNLTTTSDIVGTTFRANFKDYYDKRTILLKKVTDLASQKAADAQSAANTAQSTANSAATAAQTAQTAANSAQSTANGAQTAASAAQTAADAAQATANTAKTNAATAQTAADNAKSAADAAQADADSAAQAASTAQTAADNAQAAANSAATAASAAQTTANNAQTSATAANNLLTDLANDNKLTANEKQAVKKEWDSIVAEKPTIDGQATTYAITTEKTNYDNSYSTLNTYISPLLADLTTTSDIVGTTFRANFKDYYDKRTILLKAITDAANTKAAAAQTAANNAQTAANNAQSTADTAKTNAATAQTAANNAQSTADTAKTNAATAQSAANAAQATADTAKANAATAQTTANNAASAASTAQTAANNAQASANAAQSAADAAQADADSAATAASNAQATANSAQTAATTANNLLSDLSNDNKLTPNEKQSVKKEWDSIASEKTTIDAQATTFGITTEKTNYDNSYTALSNYVTPLLTDLTTTSDIVGTTFRSTFKDYYDKRTALLKAVTDAANTKAANAQTSANTAQTAANNAKTAADNAQAAANTAQTAANNAQSAADGAQTTANNAQSAADSAAAAAQAAQSAADAANSAAAAAQTAANNAQTSATNALNTLSDIANDNKFSPSEKQATKKEWDIIASEKSNIDAQATTYSITTEKTTYDNAYTALSNYITPLLSSLTTTSDIVGTDFRANFKAYYDARTALLKKITDTAQSLASAAQTAANNAQTAANNAQSTANSAASAASAAQTSADTAKAAADSAATAASNAQATANTASTNATAALNTLSDLSNDNKLTPDEKQVTKKEWDIIGGEKTNIDAQATTYGITTEKTTYDNAYTSLSTYITPLLTDLTTTSDIVGTTFRTNFKTYYDARTALLKKVTDQAKALADAAQTAANTAQTAANTAQTAANTAKSAADAAQATANTASANATTALNTLTDIASDNKFSPSEKQATQKEWDIVQSEKTNIDAQATTYGITTEKTTYDNAYSTLSTYITPLLTDLTTTSDIVGTTFRSNFKAYYDARTALLKKITDTAKSLADTAQTAANSAQTSANNAQSTANTASTNASTALTKLTDLASDNKLTPDEKQATQKEWDVITGEKTNIDAQATTYAITTEKTTYDNAYTTLSNYVTPFLTDLTTTSDIVGTTFRSNFKAYYDARTALIKKITDTAKALADAAQTAANSAQSTANTASTNASTALTTLSDIANDNKFSPSEKQATKKEWDIIGGEKTNIDAQATTYGITTEKTTYDNAYSTLSTYITPLLTDLTTTSDIVGTTFRSNFKTYYDARTALLKKITDQAKALADAAQSSANSAATAASNAQSTANTANTAAGNAQTSANNAQTTANTANSAAAVARTIAENVVIKPAFAKDFLDGMLDNITIGQGTAVVTDKATMQVTGTGADTTITFTPPASIDGGQNEKIAFRIRYIADQSTTNLPTWQGQIYYATETVGAYTGHGTSESYTYKGLAQPPKDGSWAYFLADMTNLVSPHVGGTDWRDNNIASVRLDLWNYAIFEIQFFAIGTVSPNFATPEDVNIVASEVNAVQLDITSDKILEKLSSNVSFTQMMGSKADAEDLGSYVSNEDLNGYKTDVTNEINDAIGAQDFSDFVTSTELSTEVDAINAKFEAGGGVNMVKNSTGLSNFDFWTTSYVTRMNIVTNADLEKMGFVAGFNFPPLTAGSDRYIVQTVPVKIGKKHTISWNVNKKNASPSGNNDGAFVIQILNPDGTGLSDASQWYNSEVVTNGYETGSFTFTPLTDTIQIRVYAYGLVDAIIAGLMMNLGTNAFQWTMANGELYNTNVGFDLNGIRVSQMTDGKESARTVMTPTKFAGYYDVNGDGVIDVGTGSLDEVFRMDKDEFVMKKAVVREVMTLGKVKIIMVDGGGNTGIAFVPNT